MTIDLQKVKTYWSFLAIILLFTISAIYSLFIYLNWDKQPEKKDTNVEINLPVINWALYGNLSKKMENDNLSSYTP